jgi:AraC family transcriptional regulator, transcriptional activator of pobA
MTTTEAVVVPEAYASEREPGRPVCVRVSPMAVRPPRVTLNERSAVPAFFLYGEPYRAPDAATVHVETIAARSSLHDWKIRAHRHRDLHQVLIVWRGPIEAQLDGQRSVLRSPAFVIVPPLTVHSFEFGKQTDGLVVTFSACLAREIFRDNAGLCDALLQSAAREFRRAELAATDVERLTDMLMREFSRYARGRDSALRGLLTGLLTNVLRICEHSVLTPPSVDIREHEMVARFREIVERDYRKHREVGAYAREIGTTEAALRKACSRVAGQSPTQFVHARVMLEAERQLRYTGMSITQIGSYLGFDDPAYFSRFFAKGMGRSPRSFRRAAGTI